MGQLDIEEMKKREAELRQLALKEFEQADRARKAAIAAAIEANEIAWAMKAAK